ncbi:MAG: serine/threonine protein kinase [Woeseiaceae bacterium]
MFISERAKDLFSESLALDPALRIEFLTTQCGEDKHLFDEVSSLLDASEQSEHYFNAMVEQVSLSALTNIDDAVHEGKQVGQWRLLECIGRGGMGTVYLADRADRSFDKKAAVKLLPFGMDGAAARARFVQERQILATLSHDNIARLLDGGVTDDGVPFFVMDFVDGTPIDVYCDEYNLDIHARLRLALEVAEALQYAHRNLVIHRDLKPNNILIDDTGSVRLLDFGIAKLLNGGDSSADLTRQALRPVTPVFASPEMLAGEHVDVTTDVYSLGVLIFMLLTSHLPVSYEGMSLAATIEHARTTMPPPPSFLDARIDPDLDAVVGKALAREPDQRYESVESVANDLRAYLVGRPVIAREPTLWYRLSRFVRRNRFAVIGSGAVSMAMLGMAGIAMHQADEAAMQRDAVIAEQRRTRASNEFFGGLIDELNNEPMTSLQLLDRGASVLQQQYGNEQPFMAYSLYELARRYARLRETDKQVALLEQTVRAAEANHDQSLQAAALCRLSGAVSARDGVRSSQYFADGHALFLTLATPSLEASVDCLRMLAVNASSEDDQQAALDYMFEAKAIIAEHGDVSVDVEGPVLGYIAHLYFKQEAMPQALQTLDETLDLLDANGRGNSMGYLRVSANKAVTLNAIGQIEASLAEWESIVQRLRISGFRQRGAGGFLIQYADSLARAGQMEKSVALHQEGLAIAQEAGDLRNVAFADLGLARGAIAQEQFNKALRHLDQVGDYANQDPHADVAATRGGKVLRIKIYRKTGQLDLALDLLNALLDEIGYPEVNRGRQLLSTLIEAAELHSVRQEFGVAERYAGDAIDLITERAVGDPMISVDVGRAYVHRAEIRAASGNPAGAMSDLEVGIPVLLENLGSDHKETIAARGLLDRLGN